MSYLVVGIFLLALPADAGSGAPAAAGMAPTEAQSAVATRTPAAVQASKPTPSPNPTPNPTALAASPVLAQQSLQTWATTIYLNTAALRPIPFFDLVTTAPYYEVPGATPLYSPKSKRRGSVTTSPARMTRVQLTFGPSDELASAPVAAAVVVTSPLPTVPLSITAAVHRRGSWYRYIWILSWCGLGLAVLLVVTMLAVGLPDPDAKQDQPTS